jgi:hypothetical protein
MVSSKRFLCGAEGSFEKYDRLAFTFAENADKKGVTERMNLPWVLCRGGCWRAEGY